VDSNRLLIAVFVGVAIGLVGGGLVGYGLFCGWLLRTSNMCGVVPVLLSPALAIVGGIGGYAWAHTTADSVEEERPE
jgi:hypothetical protein